MKKILLCFSIVFFSLTYLHSTHLAGGEITYVNVGKDAYKVTLTLYGDCTGNLFLFDPPYNFDLDIRSNSCSINTTERLVRDTSFQVSAICPSKINVSSPCGGSGTKLPIGYNVYIYSKIINLQPCNDYVISYKESARNAGITNLSGSGGLSDLYLELTANLVAGRNNSSAQFFAYPTPTFLTYTIGSFNNASYDPNRDSLYYELVDARSDSNAPIPYNTGYSAINPIRNNSAFNFDQNIGLITVVPNQEEIDAIVMRVSEYREGVLLGTVSRDIQVNVQRNTNNNKLPQTGSNINDPPQFKDIVGGYKLANITYPKSLTEVDSINSFRICPGDSLVLEIEITDPDASQDLHYIRSNYNLTIPGSKLTINKLKNNKIKAKFEWLASANDIGYNSFSIIVGDDQCDYFYKSYFTYNIRVNPKIELGPDKVICKKNDSVKLILNYPGNSRKWYALKGDSIQVGVNFSCDTCSIVYAKPSQTTTYYVTNKFLGNSYFCDSTDIITVHVIPEYSLTTIASDSTVCRGEEFTVSTFPAPIVDFEFNYSWSPKYAFDNPNSKSPKVTLNKSGLQKVYVTVNNRGACEKKDSIEISVSQGYSPDIEWLNKSNIIPCPDSVFNFITRPGVSIPGNCGVSSTLACKEISKITEIGTSSGLININNSLPAPMANSLQSIKQQFLYKREELINSGFIGGKITALYFFITGFSSGNSSDSLKIDDFSVKIGCTNADSLTDFISSLSPVSGSPLIRRNFIAKKGWNQINFQVGYEWDGQSNIVIEICTRVNSSGSNQNPTFLIQETNFPSFQRATSGTNACSINTSQPPPNVIPWNTASGNYNNRRPLTRFKYCNIFGDPANYTYNWTPGKFLNDSTIYNPKATLSKNQTFHLTITEKNYSCSDSDSYEVIIGCCTEIKQFKITDSLCPSDSSGVLEFRTFGADPPYRVIITNSKNDTLRNILTSSLFSLGNLYADTFRIKIIDKKNCITDTLVFIKPLSLNETILGVKPTCPGDLLKVFVDTLGKGYSTLKWSNGSTSDTTKVGIGNVTLFINKNGCTYPIKAVIPKALVPNSNFIITPASNGYSNETVTFTARENNAVSYTWNLGGGSNPIGNKKIVANKYSNSKVYKIQLITKNKIGCKDTTTVEYAILGDVNLPNVITPNGDGKNDVLIISDLKNVVFENTIRIFNRWGKLVYKETNYKNNWGGEDLEPGTYFYTLTINDSKKTSYKGYIELIKE